MTTVEAPAPGVAERRAGWAARSLVWLVHVYQLARSGRPSGCRFLPSCSAYAVEAIETHGAGRGAGLAVRRLLRCHPWGGHGFDPVPGEEAPCRP